MAKKVTSLHVLISKPSVLGMWDRYKLISQGPPSIESTIPNYSAGSNISSFSVYHVNNELESPKSIAVSPVATSPSTNSSNDGDESMRLPIKNDNILSRQQPVGKIQPYQVDFQLLTLLVIFIRHFHSSNIFTLSGLS